VFQFLLGRLETSIDAIHKIVAKRFQFLLGRLETPLGQATIAVGALFQFLLGRLETRIPAGDYGAVQRFNSS